MAKRRDLSLSDLFPVTSRKNAAKRLRRKSGANLAAGIVAGAAIGAVAGILLAPKSGKETREDIKMKTGEVAAKVKDKTVAAYKTVKQKIKPVDDESDCIEAEIIEDISSEI